MFALRSNHLHLLWFSAHSADVTHAFLIWLSYLSSQFFGVSEEARREFPNRAVPLSPYFEEAKKKKEEEEEEEDKGKIFRAAITHNFKSPFSLLCKKSEKRECSYTVKCLNKTTDHVFCLVIVQKTHSNLEFIFLQKRIKRYLFVT